MEIKVCNNVEIKSRLVCLENSGIQKVWQEMELCHAFKCRANEFDLIQ